MLLGPALGWAQQGADDAERARIEQARQTVNANFDALDAACQKRFAVTDCLAQTKSQRRAALADLHRQEAVLNDAQRRQAGGQKLNQLADKQQDAERSALDKQAQAASKAGELNQRLADKAERSAESTAQAKQRQSEQAHKQSTRKLPDPAAEQSAQADYQRKQADAEQHRLGLEKRLKNRSKAPSPPLPAPSS